MIALGLFVLCKVILETEFYFIGATSSLVYSKLNQPGELIGIVGGSFLHVMFITITTCMLSLLRLSIRSQWQRKYCGDAMANYISGSLKTDLEMNDLEQRLLDDGKQCGELEMECLDKVLLPFLVLFYTWQSYQRVPYKLATPIVYLYVMLSVFLIKMPLALFKEKLARQSQAEGVLKATLCWIRQHEELIFLTSSKSWHLSYALNELDHLINASLSFGQVEAVVDTIKTAVSYSGATINYLIIALYLSILPSNHLEVSDVSQYSFLCLMLINKLNELLAIVDLMAKRQVFANRLQRMKECMRQEQMQFIQSPHLIIQGVQVGNNQTPFNLDTTHHRVTWICGPNGSGKSSLVKHIAGYWGSQGLILRPDLLFIIPQGPLQIPAIKWPEIISYPDHHQSHKSDESIAEWLSLVGLSAHRPPMTPGEWQRAHLARLLHHKPKVAILDEPCSHIGSDDILINIIDKLNTIFIILTPNRVSISRNDHQVINLINKPMDLK